MLVCVSKGMTKKAYNWTKTKIDMRTHRARPLTASVFCHVLSPTSALMNISLQANVIING